jgi:hypothetical protein
MALLLSMVMLLSVTAGLDFSANALSSSGSCGTNVTYTFNSSTGLLTISGSGAINSYANLSPLSPFANNSTIKKVVINEGVTRIGANAFLNCTSLISVSFPNSLFEIVQYAFKGCTELSSVTIPDSVMKVDSTAFINTAYYNDSSNWEDDVLYIDNHLIKAKETVSGKYIIRSGTVSINGGNSAAFSGCLGLSSVVIPSSVRHIGAYAFRDCTGLTSITIPNSVSSIGDDPFLGCSSLKSIIVSKNNKYFDSRSNCNAIIKTSTNELIAGCINTTIPADVISICSFAFSCIDGLTNIEIPEGVENIRNHAFYRCDGLTSITISNSVIDIDKSSFYMCNNINSISVHSNNAFYDSRDNCNAIIDSKKNELVIGCKTSEIPKSINSIGGSAFSGCLGLSSIIIPNSILSIGDYAFYDCQNLTDVYYLGTNWEWENIEIGEQNGDLLGAAIHCYCEVHSPSKEVIENYEASTCINKGSFDEVVYCSVCGFELSRDSKTEYPLGHNFVYNKTVEPTLTTEGFSIYTCTRCDEQYKDDFIDQLTLPFNTYVNSYDTETYKVELNKSGYLIFDFAGESNDCEIKIYDEDYCLITTMKPVFKEFYKKSYLQVRQGSNIPSENQIVALLAGNYYIEVKCAPDDNYSGYYEMSINYHSSSETITETKHDFYYDALTATDIDLNKTYNGFLGGKYTAYTYSGNLIQTTDTRDAYAFLIPQGSGRSQLRVTISTKDFPPIQSDCKVIIYNEEFEPCVDFEPLTLGANESKSETVYLFEGLYYIAVSIDSGIIQPIEYTFSTTCIPECKKHNYTSKVTKAATCTKAGVRTYTCTNCGESYTESIKALGHNYKTTIKKATPDKSGYVDNVCSRCKDTKHKYLAPVKAKLSITTYTYNGKAKKPSVTVYDSETGSSISKDYYTVTYPSGRKKIGTYTVKITLKGKYYSGTIKKSFKIVKKVTAPAKVTGVSGVITIDNKSKKVSFKATWKKVSGAEGYQVQTAEVDPRGGKFWHTAKNISGGSKTSYTEKEIYGSEIVNQYVKVRAYKMADGKKIYGKWSTVATTKIKKK